jgi:hypothetical protein
MHMHSPRISFGLVVLGLDDKHSYFKLAYRWTPVPVVDMRIHSMVYAKTDPLLDSIRPGPRFAALVTRVGQEASEMKR